MKDLQNGPTQPGLVVSIYTRPARLAPVISHPEISALANEGLAGDRYKGNGARQVTLISKENLSAVSSYLSKEISGEQVRRNILTKGINLLALKGKQFFVGDALFEYSGECHPCSRMELNLGSGGYNAMRGNGGITARILKSGIIRIDSQIFVQ